MRETHEMLPRKDGGQVFVRTWHPDASPRAVMLVLHGMQEHGGRYGGLARALEPLGLVVVVPDHRGHGRSVSRPEALGVLGPEGHEGVIRDIELLMDLCRSRYPGLPLVLLGHSWGSFLAQAVAQRRGGDLAGLVLSGTNGRNPLVLPGVLLARLVCAFRGSDRPADLLETLSMGHFNRAFEPGPTGKEWLSRDPEEVRAYVQDPACGFKCPNSFFLEMVRLLHRTWRPTAEARMPRHLPVLFLTGTEDPVSEKGRGVRVLIDRWRRGGMEDLSARWYAGARHEVFHEINREQVFEDLRQWLRDRVLHAGPEGGHPGSGASRSVA